MCNQQNLFESIVSSPYISVQLNWTGKSNDPNLAGSWFQLNSANFVEPNGSLNSQWLRKSCLSCWLFNHPSRGRVEGGKKKKKQRWLDWKGQIRYLVMGSNSSVYLYIYKKNSFYRIEILLPSKILYSDAENLDILIGIIHKRLFKTPIQIQAY